VRRIETWEMLAKNERLNKMKQTKANKREIEQDEVNKGKEMRN